MLAWCVGEHTFMEDDTELDQVGLDQVGLDQVEPVQLEDPGNHGQG